MCVDKKNKIKTCIHSISILTIVLFSKTNELTAVTHIISSVNNNE